MALPADPWSAVGGAIGTAAAGGPSAASSDGNWLAGGSLDGSGWTVATGQGKSDGAILADGGTGGMGQVPTVALIVGAAVLLGVLLWKR